MFIQRTLRADIIKRMPSKKFVIVTLAVLLLIAGIFWLSRNKNLKLENRTIFQKQGSLMPFQQNGDSDWEGVLSRTSIYTNINAPTDESIDYNTSQFSETERFSQDFLSQYLIAKDEAGGGNLNEATKDKLINSLIGSINLSPPIYHNLSDLKISGDNSQTAVRDYGNKLSLIVRSYSNPEPGNEVSVFAEIVKNNDESMVSQLDKSVSLYDNLKKDVLALTVPSEIKSQHLKFVNSLVLLKDITEKFRNYFNDPLTGLIASKQYQEAATNYVDSITAINTFLRNK